MPNQTLQNGNINDAMLPTSESVFVRSNIALDILNMELNNMKKEFILNEELMIKAR
jgi:hypothetical protein